MHKEIYELIYTTTLDDNHHRQTTLLASIDQLIKEAFVENNQDSLLTAHRVLYQLNLAFFGVSWELSPINIMHPLLIDIKYRLEKNCENKAKQHNQHIANNLPKVSHFSSWVKEYVLAHHSNKLHPLFTYLRDQATFEQMREFFFQETPLEMLFGDIIACMLPGVYGSIKIEFIKNYWDEVGHAQDHLIHRNLRAHLMHRLQIPSDCYITNYELLICKELELINMYLSLATNRAKHTQLIGVMLATELMIPGRFEYLIEGCKRFDFNAQALHYLIEHTSVDEVHAQDWLEHVVMPILNKNAFAMTDIVLGISRRLETSAAVLDCLYTRVQNTHTACIGACKETNSMVDLCHN